MSFLIGYLPTVLILTEPFCFSNFSTHKKQNILIFNFSKKKKKEKRKRVVTGLEKKCTIYSCEGIIIVITFALPLDPAGGLDGPLDPRPSYTPLVLLAMLQLDSNFMFCFEVFKSWQVYKIYIYICIWRTEESFYVSNHIVVFTKQWISIMNNYTNIKRQIS